MNGWVDNNGGREDEGRAQTETRTADVSKELERKKNAFKTEIH